MMLQEIANAINNSENILIMPHKSADGDCIGSALALKLGLISYGKNASVLFEPSDEDNRIFAVTDDIPSEIAQPDLIIAVDCGDTERLGSRRDKFESFDKTVNIDHHATNIGYATINFIDKNAAATGEIIFRLLRYMNVSLDKGIAKNLYVAIASDTGGFAYSNTTPETHCIAAELIKYDIDFPYLNAYIFNTRTYRELQLARAALESMEVFVGGRIAAVTVDAAVIKKFGATDSELGGLVDFPKSLDTAEIAIYFKETDGGVKVSMRSTGADVSEIAVRFGGGGHTRASGCFIAQPLTEVKKMIIEAATAAIGGEQA